jgi:hypothetical protein
MKRDVIVILPILLVLRDRARLAHCFLATGHRQELCVGGGELTRPPCEALRVRSEGRPIVLRSTPKVRTIDS